MTKDEAKQILERIMNNNFYGGEVQTACKMGIKALSKPELPSVLDEAANEEADELLAYMKIDGDMIYLPTAKALMIVLARFGAEWMAGQFQKIEGKLVDWYSTSDGKDYCCGVKTIDAFEVPEGFYIRKKQ